MKRSGIMILIIRLLLVLTCAGSLFQGIQIRLVNQEFMSSYFMTAFTALLTIGITYIPDFIVNKDIMIIPAALQTVFTIFTFLAMFFGEILRFYDHFFWWDIMLHLISGVIFSILGFMLFVSLNRSSAVRRQLNPISVVLFALCFSMTCGTIWEIFEFTGDSLLGMNMQRWKSNAAPELWAAMRNVSNMSNPGLIDTMKDIIIDTVGSLISLIFIIPMAKRDNKYEKTKITSQEILEEEKWFQRK